MSRTATVSRFPDSSLFEELIDAWGSLGSRHATPERIDVLKGRRRPKVCRLVSSGPGGQDIVAKCSNIAAVEPFLYEHVLPAVTGAPRCHGIAPGRDGGRCWIFLEHVEGEQCTATVPAHRALTARWLGALHSITSNMRVGQLLPWHDSVFYRSQLHTARHAMAAALGNSMIDGAGRSRLAAAVDRCDYLESQWDALEILTEDVRPSLVHGDLKSKNVRIRRRVGDVELLAFDWEFSGYGVPVADFAQFAVEGWWRDLSGILDQMGFTDVSDHHRVWRLVTVGKILRLITCLEWESRQPHALQESNVRTLATYDLWLDECLRSLAMRA